MDLAGLSSPQQEPNKKKKKILITEEDPPGNADPEPFLEKALKNWKQTHRPESVTHGAKTPTQGPEGSVSETRCSLKRLTSGK